MPNWDIFKAGDIVYFYREQKPASQRGAKKKKLLLRQWHGPAMIVAVEGGRVPTAAYVVSRQSDQVCSTALEACLDVGEASKH